jgi:serine/threonine protein kinase
VFPPLIFLQVRDPADGNMYLYRYLACPFEEDAAFALQQLRQHEDRLASCPYLMRVVGAATAFASPVVAPASGARQGVAHCVVCVLSFAPGGQCADRVGAPRHAATPRRQTSAAAWGLSPGQPGAGGVSDGDVVRWARDAAAGLRALHAAGLTHRNLHPRNVHLDARGRAVVTGFQVLQNPRAPGDPYSWGRADCGSPLVRAPEVDGGHPVSAAADVWALGVCVLAWCTGDVDGGGVTASAKDRSLDDLLRAVPRRFGSALRSCLRMCLQHHPAKRAAAADVWKVLSTSKK